MNNSPLITIVVPVYNIENYLDRCISSIINQSFQNFELILVDDGSSDSSGSICDKYAQNDNRIKVIHKTNGGVASARDYVLVSAEGEYIIHVDPDDWVEPNMLDELYKKACTFNADMVICDYFLNDRDDQKYVKQEPTDCADYRKIIHEMLYNLHGSCWNKLVRRSCILKNNIHFIPGINYCEDLLFNIKLLSHDIKVVYLPKAFYHYVQLGSSAVHHKDKIFFKYAMDVVKELEMYPMKESVSQEDIDFRKAKIKAFAFYECLFSSKEYSCIYPEVSHFVLLRRREERGFSAMLFIISRYCYTIASILYKIIIKKGIRL